MSKTNVELEWTTLPRGTRTATLNPVQIDCFRYQGKWRWTALNLVTKDYVGCGDCETESKAMEDSVIAARNYLHPLVIDDKEWHDVHCQIDADAAKHKLTDIDAMVAWKLGLSAWKEAHEWGAKFTHEV